MDGLWTLLGNIKDTATLVLILALGGLGWLHISTVRENREDRKTLMDLIAKQAEATAGLKEALSGLKNVLSASLGKPL